MMMDDPMDALGVALPNMDDDLFGDGVLPMPNRPPSKQLQQRVDQMRSRGCCRYDYHDLRKAQHQDPRIVADIDMTTQDTGLLKARHHSVCVARRRPCQPAVPKHQPVQRLVGAGRASSVHCPSYSSARSTHCASRLVTCPSARAGCHRRLWPCLSCYPGRARQQGRGRLKEMGRRCSR